MLRSLFFGLLFTVSVLHAQQLDHQLIDELKYHVNYLADDSLEGRATASKGEKMASDYISRQYKAAGLQPYPGKDSYLQPFNYIEGRLVGKNNTLTLNGNVLKLDKDFYPLAYSGNGKANGACVDVGFGITASELKHDDYKKKDGLTGKIFLINISTPSGTNPHGKFGNYTDLRARVETALQKDAIAVIFYASEDSVPDPEQLLNKNIYPVSIPVVYLKTHAWKEFGGENMTANISTELSSIEKTGHNVVGMIDNGAKTTVVIGAHYDHLGWGEEGSLYRGEKAIHNGADDNASGVALIMELADKLKQTPLKNNNYLFIAFSGEEMGLFGSKKFVEQIGEDVKNVSYMLNFDMVGRLNPNEKTLQVNGFGTSPAWKVLLAIPTDSIRIKTSDSGIGPSDHTSFCLKDIPVLHFFTGAHEDYHKPSDDAAFVNYAGIASVMNLTYALIDSLDNDGKPAFTAVKEDANQAAPRFTVTLGVIPDYVFSGEGMRIDGVTDGKPASKAGLLKGDVVLKMGEHKVSDMMSYMEALSKFKKGDTTKVIALREGKEMKFEVTF